MNKITIRTKVDGKEIVVSENEKLNFERRLSRLNDMYLDLQKEAERLSDYMRDNHLTCSYIDTDEQLMKIDWRDFTLFENVDFDELCEAAEATEDTYYIGLLKAYFEDDDNSVFAPKYWDYTTNPYDLEEVKGELTADGLKRIKDWEEAQSHNAYQRAHSFGYFKDYNMSSWQLYEELIQNYTMPE